MKLNFPILILAAAEEYLDDASVHYEARRFGFCNYAYCYVQRHAPQLCELYATYDIIEELYTAGGLTHYFGGRAYVGGSTGRTTERLAFVRDFRDYLRSYVGLS